MNLELLFSLQCLTAREEELRLRLKTIPQYQELKEMKETFAGYQKMLQRNKAILAEIDQNVQKMADQLAQGEAEQKKVSGQLYDGAETNPRELELIQEHLATIVDQCDQLQNELVILNGDREDAMAENKTIDREMQITYAEFNSLKDQYTRIKINLEQDLAGVMADRAGLLQKLTAADQSWFEQQKNRFAGTPIGEVGENHSCHGCHTVVPSIMVRYAREKPGEVNCEYCGRVLYVPWSGDK